MTKFSVQRPGSEANGRRTRYSTTRCKGCGSNRRLAWSDYCNTCDVEVQLFAIGEARKREQEG